MIFKDKIIRCHIQYYSIELLSCPESQICIWVRGEASRVSRVYSKHTVIPFPLLVPFAYGPPRPRSSALIFAKGETPWVDPDDVLEYYFSWRTWPKRRVDPSDVTALVGGASRSRWSTVYSLQRGAFPCAWINQTGLEMLDTRGFRCFDTRGTCQGLKASELDWGLRMEEANAPGKGTSLLHLRWPST